MTNIESTLQEPVVMVPKGAVVGFWIATELFCLQMSFTAYAQLSLPQVTEACAHLAVGNGPEAGSWAAGVGALSGLSYFFWRRRQVSP